MIIKKKYRGPTLRIAIGITMLVMLLSGIGTAMTAPHEEWSRSYGGNSTEHAYDIQQTPDGGYVFVGSTSSFGAGNGDAWFMKIDAFGNEVINKTFGGAKGDIFRSFVQISDGGFALLGATGSFGVGAADVWLVKLDALGKEKWNRTYGGIGGEQGNAIKRTPDGGFAIVGRTTSFGVGGGDILLLKVDALGNELWNRTFGGAGNDGANSVYVTPDGEIIIAGFTSSFGAGLQDVWLIKTDSLGNELLNRTFGEYNNESAYSVYVTPSDEIVIAGVTSSFGAGSNDVWLIKTDSLGNELLNRTFGGAGIDDAYSVYVTPDGEIIIAGATTSFGAGGQDIWLIKTDSLGNELWNQTFGDWGSDVASSGRITSDGGYILAGGIIYPGDVTDNALIVKVSKVTENLFPNLQLSKTAPVSADNGTQMSYVLNFSNLGGAIATGVILVDTLPSDVVFVNASDDGTYDPTTGNVIWNPASMPSYSSAVRTVTVEIPASVPVGTVIMNTASVSTIDIESNFDDNSATASTTVRKKRFANLQLSKTAPGSADNGTQMSYALNFSNSGGAIATNVTIVDTLPLNVELISASGDYSYDPVTRNIMWNLGTVGTYPDGSGSRTVTVEIPRSVPIGTVIENTASISTTDVESNYDNNSATASTTVTEKMFPNLQLSKTAPVSADNGTQMTYTLNISNLGGAIATGVILVDTLPSDVVFVSASDDGTYDSVTRNVIWNPSFMPAYSNAIRTVTVEIPASVPVGTVIMNTASISTADLESDFSDNSASVTTTVIENLFPNLELSKTAPGSADNGTQMSYTLNFSNLGGAIATNVTIVDTLPLNVELVSASGDYSYDPATRNIMWNLGTVGTYPDESGSMTVTVEIPTSVISGTVIENTASISSTDIESDYSDNSATASTTVTEKPLANLQLVKTAPVNANNGTRMTYTLNLSNLGGADATGVILVDMLPSDVAFVNASDDGTYDSVTRNVTWNPGSIPAYSNTVRTMNVSIRSIIPVGKVIINTASASTTYPESDYADNNASAITTVMEKTFVNLILSKTGRINASNRSQVIYTLNMSNSGNAPAMNVTLVDTLPLGVVFVNASGRGVFDPITRNVTWIPGRINASVHTFRTLTVQIPADTPVGTVIENTAVINTSSLESNYSDNSASATITVADVSLANLQVSKTGPVKKDHGTPMTYTLYFSNQGDTATTGVMLVDMIPLGVEFVSASDDGIYDPITRNVTWHIDSVLAYPDGYGSRTVMVQIPESAPIGTVIQNIASISTADIESEYSDNTATASTTVTGTVLPANVSIEPTTGNSGSAPSVYWGSPETFSFSTSCATGVSINIHLSDGGSDITGSMTQSAPGVWTYTTTFYPRHGSATVVYTVIGCEETAVSFNIYVDPAGYIYDSVTDGRISGASVWLQQPDGLGGWMNVSVGQDPAVMQPDANPLITGIDGQYQWDVLPGIYRVHIEADGYYPADSIVVSIPPPVTDLHVGLTRIPVPDNTPPVITIDTPTNTNYILGQSVLANWQIIDTDSGVKTKEATAANGNAIDTATVGSKTFTVTTADNAGNEATKTVNYNIVYNFSGIFQPVDADSNSVFKYGSTVPVKFQLRDSSGNFITDAIAKIYVAKSSDGIIGTDMEAVSTNSATTGNLFRYDSTANQYIFNLATKTLTKGTWQIRIELNDGTSKSVNIGLK